jgi:hypothetical protein
MSSTSAVNLEGLLGILVTRLTRDQVEALTITAATMVNGNVQKDDSFMDLLEDESVPDGMEPAEVATRLLQEIADHRIYAAFVAVEALALDLYSWELEAAHLLAQVAVDDRDFRADFLDLSVEAGYLNPGGAELIDAMYIEREDDDVAVAPI